MPTNEEYKEALRSAYKAFYEHPYKSEPMFDIMEKTADAIFHDTDKTATETWHALADKFYKTFENHARTQDEKSAILALLVIDV
mgnify:CR=1 FL=1